MKDQTAVQTAPEKTNVRYIGEEALEGFTETNPLTGQYWVQGDIHLFQPEGSTKVFQVNENDIELLS